MTSVTAQLSELVSATSSNCQVRGEQLVLDTEAASSLQMLWIQHLMASKLTGNANCLLDGAVSAMREGTACVTLGLVRPALASLRLQVDLLLGWLYFKDHPVEWARVQSTGDGFKLKADLLRYLQDNHGRFKDRFAILAACMLRTQEDPYRLLSAHIHAQSEMVVPQLVNPVDIVASPNLQDEFVQLQAECAEFVNDILWSLYADRWAALPAQLKDALEARFKTTAQRAKFFQ